MPPNATPPQIQSLEAIRDNARAMEATARAAAETAADERKAKLKEANEAHNVAAMIDDILEALDG